MPTETLPIPESGDIRATEIDDADKTPETRQKPKFGDPIIKKTERDLGDGDDYSSIDLAKDEGLGEWGNKVDYASVYIYPETKNIEGLLEKRKAKERVHYPKRQSVLEIRMKFEIRMPKPIINGSVGETYWYSFDIGLYKKLDKIMQEI